MSTFSAPSTPTTGLAGYDLEGQDGTKRVSKTEANYVDDWGKDTKCRVCSMFFGPFNACRKVRGDISPNGHCRFYHAAVPVEITMKKQASLAAGIAVASGEGKVLFMRRSGTGDHPGEWALPGGSVEEGETPEQAVIREVREETGFTLPPGDRRHVVTVDGDVNYQTWFQRIDDEFTPILNDEHTEYRWLAPDQPPSPLHPGLRAAMSVIVSEVTYLTLKVLKSGEPPAEVEVIPMNKLDYFVPLLKVDAKQRMVYGTAVVEAQDRAKEIFDYATSKPHFVKWSEDIRKATDGKSLGNVRAMHGKVAAGKLTNIAFVDDRKAIDVAAKIVDDAEWKKVEEGVYTGFSIGGKYENRWQDGELFRYTASPSEISLVDLPCVKEAVFTLIKVDGTEEERGFKKPVDDEPLVITNAMVAERATEMAKAAGSERDWMGHVYEARKQIEAEFEVRAKQRRDAPVVEKVQDPPRDTPKDTPRSSGTGEWEQVWVSALLPGQQFTKKADLERALIEKKAKDEIEKKGAALLDRLGDPKDIHDRIGDPKDPPTEVKNGDWLDVGLMKREYSSDERSKYAKSGVAMRDGSFPIPDKAALSDAISAFGRSKNKPAAKRHIVRRAKALGASGMLPDSWGAGSSEKFLIAALSKLDKDQIQKGASLHFVADLIHCLACVESIEDQCECDAFGHAYGFGGTNINVAPETQTRFGTLLVEFGDLVSDILGEVLATMKQEEAEEALARSQSMVDLIKVGAKHSKETLEQVRGIIASLVNTFGQDVVSPPGRIGNDGSVEISKPGSSGGSGEVTVRPRRRAGQEHPPAVSTAGVGDTSPYKDMSPEDLQKFAAEAQEIIDKLETEAAAEKTALDAFLKRIGDTVEAKLSDRDQTIAGLTKQVGELQTALEKAAGDVRAIRNQPIHQGSFRVVEKGSDTATTERLPVIGPDASEEKLREMAASAHLRRTMGPHRRTEDTQR